MGESREASRARSHAEMTRTKAIHMFFGEKKTIAEIARELKISDRTVAAWFQHIPKKNKRGRRSTEIQPVEKPLSREELLDRYFATLDPRDLHAAVNAATVTLASIETDDEDDE